MFLTPTVKASESRIVQNWNLNTELESESELLKFKDSRPWLFAIQATVQPQKCFKVSSLTNRFSSLSCIHSIHMHDN